MGEVVAAPLIARLVAEAVEFFIGAPVFEIVVDELGIGFPGFEAGPVGGSRIVKDLVVEEEAGTVAIGEEAIEEI